MMLSPEYKLHIVCSFDALCKKVMRFEAHTCYKTIKRKPQREISLDYLMEERYFETSSSDDFFMSLLFGSQESVSRKPLTPSIWIMN